MKLFRNPMENAPTSTCGVCRCRIAVLPSKHAEATKIPAFRSAYSNTPYQCSSVDGKMISVGLLEDRQRWVYTSIYHL